MGVPFFFLLSFRCLVVISDISVLVQITRTLKRISFRRVSASLFLHATCLRVVPFSLSVFQVRQQTLPARHLKNIWGQPVCTPSDGHSNNYISGASILGSSHLLKADWLGHVISAANGSGGIDDGTWCLRKELDGAAFLWLGGHLPATCTTSWEMTKRRLFFWPAVVASTVSCQQGRWNRNPCVQWFSHVNFIWPSLLNQNNGEWWRVS